MSSADRDQALLNRILDQLHPAVQVQLFENVLAVAVDRLDADAKRLGNLAISGALRNVGQYFDLAWRQWMRRLRLLPTGAL